MGSKRYSTDLSDTEWECLRAHLPAPGKRGRPRTHGLRAILDAVFLLRPEERLPLEAIAPGLPTLEDRL
jgi:hypothetical protein